MPQTVYKSVEHAAGTTAATFEGAQGLDDWQGDACWGDKNRALNAPNS
jgi:hypothetical protein